MPESCRSQRSAVGRVLPMADGTDRPNTASHTARRASPKLLLAVMLSVSELLVFPTGP
jgi:hypothetical protein